MDAEPLRATDAARLLAIPTRELLRLIYEHRIRYVIVDGIAHVPCRRHRRVSSAGLVRASDTRGR